MLAWLLSSPCTLGDEVKPRQGTQTYGGSIKKQSNHPNKNKAYGVKGKHSHDFYTCIFILDIEIL